VPSARFAARALSESGVVGAVIGRLAVWAWVPEEEQEYTKDLDLAVSRLDMPFVRGWLHKEGLHTRELSIGGVNVSYPEDGVNVDFVDRTSRLYGDLGSLFAGAVQAAVESGLTAQIGDFAFPLAPPEYLIAMKMATGEDDDERDAGRLVAHADVDVSAARALLAEHAGVAAMGRFEVLLRRSGHPAAIPRGRYGKE
jgi:hypothetical protein